MKQKAIQHLPAVFTLASTLALCASLGYWSQQLLKRPPPAAAPVAEAVAPEPSLDAAKRLFGGQEQTVSVSNYQLKGVILAGKDSDSAAILAVDGQAAVVLAAGRELSPGVVLTEIHARHVLLSEGGVPKRVELASDADHNLSPAIAMAQAAPAAPDAAPAAVAQ